MNAEFNRERAIKEFGKKPEDMTPEELKKFRNSFDPDKMGFMGQQEGENCDVTNK